MLKLTEQDYQDLTVGVLSAGQLPEDALDWYRKSITAGHTNPEILNTLGDIYLRSGRIPEAVTCFKQVADNYSFKGDCAKALAVLKKVSKLDPTQPDIAVRIGDLFARQGRIAEARTSYLSAGDYHYMSDDRERAIAAYEKATKVDSTNAPLHMMLGGLYLGRNMFRQAHDAFVNARREYLKRGDVSLARHAAESVRSIEARSQFQAARDACRRREERYALKLPAVVMGENRKWCQSTQSMNISKSGIRFGLDHAIQPDRMVALLLHVPPQLGLGNDDNSAYAVDAMVCHTERDEDGRYIVGAEFGTIARLSEDIAF
ncbi:MAG TPA: tetratricopeptide repeat protein [Blastocatellia bacterium]